MINTHQSEAEVWMTGIRQPKSLVKLIGPSGFVESLSPMGTYRKNYEHFPYRVVVYHPDVETIVKKFLSEQNVKFVKKRKT